MIKTSTNPSPWRALWLLPVSVFAVLTIVATGGGGGGGDDGGGLGGGDDLGPVTILPTYNFLLTNLNTGELLTASLGSGLSVSIDIDGLLHSSVDLSVSTGNEVTFLSYVGRAGSRFDLNVSSTGEFPAASPVAVLFTQDITVDFGSPPSSGAIDVVVPGETVTVTMTAVGVQLSVNGGDAVSYSWDEFMVLLEDEAAEAWVRRASLAVGAVEFTYELFFDVAEILDDLDVATLSNPLVESCDMFTGTPPAGVLPQGELTLTWLGSGELSPGDDFEWLFNQCWLDEPNDSTDDLIDGTILMQNYTETVDFNTNTLFEIGFGDLNGLPGVVFDVTVSETVETDGVFTIAPEGVVTVTGGFAMIIQAP